MKFLILGLVFLLASCEEVPTDLEPEQIQDPVVKMVGFLKSASSEAIRPPNGREWNYKVTSLAPEGQLVKAGDVVATLEGERTKERMREATNRMLETKVNAQQKINTIHTTIESLKLSIEEKTKELSLLQAGGDEHNDWLVSNRDRLIEKLDTKAKILDLKLSRAKLKRQLKLQSIIEVSTAKDIAADQASVDKFQSSIEDSKRIATTSGVVIYKRSPWERVKPKVGGVVYRGTEVLAIVDDKNLFIEAYLEEQYYRLVKKGDTLDIKVLGRREVNTTGVIKSISSIVLLVSDWDKGLPDGHAVLTKRAFKVVIDLKTIPIEAKPEGEVVITLRPKDKEDERAG